MQADFNKAVGDCSNGARPTTSQQIAQILPNFAALCTYVLYTYTDDSSCTELCRTHRAPRTALCLFCDALSTKEVDMTAVDVPFGGVITIKHTCVRFAYTRYS